MEVGISQSLQEGICLLHHPIPVKHCEDFTDLLPAATGVLQAYHVTLK